MSSSRCFDNASRKVTQDGGRVQLGWTFHLRFPDDIPEAAYLFLTHHAVWHAPDGRLVNVTPYPDPKRHPLPAPGSDILFLADDSAQPVRSGNIIAPLPLRFFPLHGDDRLTAHVERLNADEQEKCRRIYAAGSSSS